MENNKLFRKSALDKISSPEQLNEYMKVAGPGVWVVLAGLAVTFAAFFAWGFMGSIPETAEFEGVLLVPRDDHMAVFAYLPIEDTRQISEGMQVRVSIDYAPQEQYGYIHGTIQSIGHAPVNRESLMEFHGTDFSLLVLPAGNVIEVIVALERQDGHLSWSMGANIGVELIEGSTANITAIIAERRPYELIFR